MAEIRERSCEGAAGIIPNRREAGGTPVDGLSERHEGGGYGRGSGNTVVVPGVVETGRESGEGKDGFEGTVDPG